MIDILIGTAMAINNGKKRTLDQELLILLPFSMRGASRNVMTANDQFTRLESLEIAFFSDSGNGYRSENKENIQYINIMI